MALTLVLGVLELDWSSTSVRPGGRMNRRCESMGRDRKRGIIVRAASITLSDRVHSNWNFM